MAATVETNRDWQTHWTGVDHRSGRDELFRQVERTIKGEPIPESQIELLLDEITRHLGLERTDVLLDLCCGNGLITHRLAPVCRAVIGVDYSEPLIETARERHAPPNVMYVHNSVADLRPALFGGLLPKKVCMNASLQYFTRKQLDELLQSLGKLEASGQLLYFTDVPDASRLRAFYNTSERWAEFERRQAAGTEAMGTWWDRDHLCSLMASAGYQAEIIEPQPERFAAHYRFDVLARLR